MSLLSLLLTHCSCLLFTHSASCDNIEPAPTSRPALLLTHYSFNAHALLSTHPWATLSWLTSSASPISCLLMCYSLLTCEIWTGFTWSLLITHHLPATPSLLIPCSVNTSLLNPSLGRKCYTASSPSPPWFTPSSQPPPCGPSSLPTFTPPPPCSYSSLTHRDPPGLQLHARAAHQDLGTGDATQAAPHQDAERLRALGAGAEPGQEVEAGAGEVVVEAVEGADVAHAQG